MEHLSATEHRKLQVSIGGTVILVSFAMLFATLFLGYAIYRFSNKTWPPEGFGNISVLMPSISSLFILLSSVFLEYSHKSFLKNNLISMGLFWRLTILAGLLFVGSQFMVWNSLNKLGIFYNSGILGSILHGFTWIHVAHVFLGLISLLMLLPIMKLENYKEEYDAKFTLIKKFWHFLGVVWFAMYVGLFLV